LNYDQKILLQPRVNPLEEDKEGHGINRYNKTVQAVADILRNNH